MGLRDLIKKKEELAERPQAEEAVRGLGGPEFTFIRTDTVSQEVLHPPGDGANDNLYLSAPASASPSGGRSPRRSLDVFHRSRSASVSSQTSHQSSSTTKRLAPIKAETMFWSWVKTTKLSIVRLSWVP